MILVSVVMPVYNGERFLRETVESILNQTFINFEFIIINDGSTDNTRVILEGYDDPRIVLICNPKNIGLTCSLNKGIALARGKYLARMDADDVALPHRFEKQVTFLENHPEIGILGSNCWHIDTYGQKLGLRHSPVTDLHIRWTSLLTNPFAHPTVMLCRDVLDQHSLKYNERFRTTQDYELWTRVLKYVQGANLGEPLLYYRLADGITCTHRQAQLKNEDVIALRTIQEQLPEFAITLDQVSQLRALFVGGGEFPVSNALYVTLATLYLDMFEVFMRRYSGGASLKALRRQVVLKIVGLILRSPYQPGWAPIGQRLITIDPNLRWYFWGYLFKAVGRRLKRAILGRSRSYNADSLS